MTEELHYLGFLANVDENITHVKLDYDWTIEKVTIEEYKKFIKNTDRTYNGLNNVLYPQHGIVDNHGNIYFIKGLLENLRGNRNYINHLMSKFKLFKEGYINLPVQVGRAYISNGELRKAEFVSYSLGVNKRELTYNLSVEEASQLNKFLRDFKLPFEHYLQLALDNLEESITIKKTELSFLLSMIGFESLFNRGKNQITHTISRHTALLVGKNRRESKEIYDEMKSFYKKRSKLIHGSSNSSSSKYLEELEEDRKDIVRLRNLLRECIKKVYKLGKSKEELFDYLNERGFGDIG